MARPKSFDHVALWVSDYEGLSSFLCNALGVHLIQAGDDFHLIGADAREGKLTLFAADGEREPGVLKRVVFRVRDLAAAQAALPNDAEVTIESDGISFATPQGLRIGLVKREGIDYDLDHVVLSVPHPGATAEGLYAMGFQHSVEGHPAVGDRFIHLEHGAPAQGDRPLLNHLALLVDSADEARRQAEELGQPIEKSVDAENTLAVFVTGPDDITIEYVEHKPSFSLA